MKLCCRACEAKSSNNTVSFRHQTLLPRISPAEIVSTVAMMSASGQSDQARIWLDQLTPVKGGTPCRLESSILITKLRLSEILMNIRQDPVAGLLRESGETAIANSSWY